MRWVEYLRNRLSRSRFGRFFLCVESVRNRLSRFRHGSDPCQPRAATSPGKSDQEGDTTPISRLQALLRSCHPRMGVVVAAVLVVGGISIASAQVSSATIRACVGRSGTLKIMGTTDTCSNNETLL